MKVVAVFVNPVLFAFSFSLAMGHTAFTTLADRAVHVLGQFQHFNQICKLLHGKCIVVNAKVSTASKVDGCVETKHRKRRQAPWMAFVN